MIKRGRGRVRWRQRGEIYRCLSSLLTTQHHHLQSARLLMTSLFTWIRWLLKKKTTLGDLLIDSQMWEEGSERGNRHISRCNITEMRGTAERGGEEKANMALEKNVRSYCTCVSLERQGEKYAKKENAGLGSRERWGDGGVDERLEDVVLGYRCVHVGETWGRKHRQK